MSYYKTGHFSGIAKARSYYFVGAMMLMSACGQEGESKKAEWNSYYYGYVPPRAGGHIPEALSEKDIDKNYRIPNTYAQDDEAAEESYRAARNPKIVTGNGISINPH